MAQYIYTMNRVSKVVPPKRVILRDISLSFFPGAKIGVLGLNGAGKSTLLRIMAGVDQNYDGEARPQPGIRIGYLPQEPELDPEKDVRSTVIEGLGEVFRNVQRFNEISEKFAEPMSEEEMNALLEEQAKLQDAIDAAGGWELERKLEIAADALRLPPWDAKIAHLSGGEKRRVALCRLLLSQPDMLLLDEPTNHLDAESIAWLEKYLEQYPSTVIAVTHDRYFLDNVAEWILELDRGHGIPWHGNYSSWLEQKEKRLAQEEREREALRKTLQRELEWVRQNPRGRQAKSKARLQRYEELCSREFQERNETNEIYIPPGDRLGDLVIEVKNLRKGYGDRLLIDNLSFDLPRNGIRRPAEGIHDEGHARPVRPFRDLEGARSHDAPRGGGHQVRLQRNDGIRLAPAVFAVEGPQVGIQLEFSLNVAVRSRHVLESTVGAQGFGEPVAHHDRRDVGPSRPGVAADAVGFGDDGDAWIFQAIRGVRHRHPQRSPAVGGCRRRRQCRRQAIDVDGTALGQHRAGRDPRQRSDGGQSAGTADRDHGVNSLGCSRPSR